MKQPGLEAGGFEKYRKKTRSRVEHIFAVMKLQFGFKKVRYRGLEQKKCTSCFYQVCIN